jgi:[acyl-carrier-protein] S-malonyltransferase
MGSDFYYSYSRYRETFDRCASGAGIDLKAACFRGEGMDGSGVIQPAIYAHSVSLLRTLEAEGVQADVYAGLSLGEYAALCAAAYWTTRRALPLCTGAAR